MKRRRILLMLALATVAMAFVVFWRRGPKEPVYQGKRLSEWIAEASQPLTHDPDGRWNIQQKRDAEKAIHSFGTNALPYLLYEFTRPISKWQMPAPRKRRPRCGVS